MINKQIFFIWIGKNIPNYVNYTINIFKDVNPNYKIDLIYSESLNNNDVDFKTVKNEIENGIYKDFYNRKFAIENYRSKCGKISNFVDCLKKHIINKYGGIYLDCDTFPVKPFDNKLLNNKCFCFNTIDYFTNKRWMDCFFLGSQVNEYDEKNIKNYWMYNYKSIDVKNNNLKDDFIKERKLFFDCKLKYNFIDGNDYIKHYRSLEWLK